MFIAVEYENSAMLILEGNAFSICMFIGSWDNKVPKLQIIEFIIVNLTNVQCISHHSII